MESARSYRATKSTVRKFSIMEYQQELTQGNNALNTAINNQNAEETSEQSDGKTDASDTGEKALTLQDWQTRFRAGNVGMAVRNSSERTYLDIRQTTIQYIFELLFASRRERLSKWHQDSEAQTGSYFGYQDLSMSTDAGNANTGKLGNGLLMMEPRAVSVNMRVLNYSQETYFEESEDTTFQTTGTVHTSDGRDIQFNVNVAMSRSFQEYYREDLELASFSLCDPLVINLDTDLATLDDQTFYFDIDADGEMDEVSGLNSASGYLALDKNEDGVINDGNELFGTSSGNGFADLAKYDEDGNGWIDENDAVWQKLKIWTKNEQGKDVLYSLAEKGVGAICLKNAETDFTQKNIEGQTLGAIRRSGIFLYENGDVGTVQHVDVAKYNSIV